MALLQYFRSVPGEHLPLPGQSLVSAKGLIFCETIVARKFTPRIITVIQPKRPPRNFSPAKNTRYMVYYMYNAQLFVCLVVAVVLPRWVRCFPFPIASSHSNCIGSKRPSSSLRSRKVATNVQPAASSALRQAGSGPAAEVFRDLLSWLRDGNISQDDWQMLLQHALQHANNVHEFNSAVSLFYTKESIAIDNGVHRSPLQPRSRIHRCRGRLPSGIP